MRQAFDLYACVRPARTFPGVPHPLRTERAIDLVVVRENSEGEYVDNGGVVASGTPDEVAVQSAVHTRRGVERILRFSFELAHTRRRRLTMITKSNAQRFAYVLWDRVFSELMPEYPGVATEKLHIDAATLELVRRPHTFDVVVGSNLFGDILSDLTGGITGSLGLNPSANLDPTRRSPSLFEPVHGSAPDIAGRGVANPTGAILSAAMMLEWLGEPAAAAALRAAVERALAAGALTPDLGGTLTTTAMTTKDRGAPLVVNATPLVWRTALPLLAGAAIALTPAPAGLAGYAWHYFAAFVVVILLLITEPLPAAAIGLIGVTAVASTETALQSRPTGRSRLPCPGRDPEMDARRIRQRHGVADLRGLHRRDGLREDAARPPNCAVPRQATGQTNARPRLRNRALRPRAGRVHTVEHRAQRGDDLPDHPQHPGTVRIAPGRRATADWRLSHVGGIRHDLRHELHVRHRARAEPPGARDGEDPHRHRHHVDRLAGGVSARGPGAPAPAAVRRLQAVSTRDCGERRSAAMGGARATADGASSRDAKRRWRH